MKLAAAVAVWVALVALLVVDAPGEDHLLTTALLLAVALTAATVDRLTRTLNGETDD
ncbi:hypothetical protein HMPREF0569_1584 [Micrococcus luteus SK58]|uniref:hypothetical protein n=1 Tax=Micrococcus luteus TaxID=1270 RepID=UPI0001C4FFDE|nr:hypothetical protein [Micrococcus luteus]EFD50331.1 hypothetical protein HMPREF0569_1584 [Micrococcus luteus SK58]